MSIFLALGYIRYFAPLFTWKTKIGKPQDLGLVFKAMSADESEAK